MLSEGKEEDIQAEVAGQLKDMLLQKNSFAEVVNSRREIEETCIRIAKKELLMKEKAQLIIDLTASERENRKQSEIIAGLRREKEALETAREQMLCHIQTEKDMVEHFDRERAELEQELVTTQKDRDDCLMLAEKEKQQALSLVEQEKNELAEKLANTQRDLQNTELFLDRMQKEVAITGEQEKTSVSNLETELKKVRNQFKEATNSHEKKLKNLNNHIADLNRQKEVALRERTELEVQLRMSEETRDSIRRDLIEANKKIREDEEGGMRG